jgi:hypothetical protein
MAIIIKQKESPLCLYDSANGITVYASTYAGIIPKIEELAKQYDAPIEKNTAIVKKVLNICEKERLEGGSDFKETTGNNAGPQVDKYLKFVGLPSGNPWCTAFACWILGQSGIENPKSGDTWELEKWAMKEKIYYSENPQPGDIFLKLDGNGKPEHTGFVKEVDPTDKRYLLTLEGNAGDSIKHCNDKKVSGCKYIRWQELKK